MRNARALQLAVLLVAFAVRDDAHPIRGKARQRRFDIGIESARQEVVIDIGSNQLIGCSVGERRFDDLTKAFPALLLD